MSEYTLQPPLVKRLERSNSEKVFAGVCGGLGRYFDLAPAVFRLGFVVLTLLGGAGILVYVAAALVIPDESKERSYAEEVLAERREHPARLVALGLVGVALATLLARASSWPSEGAAWILVVAGLVVLWASAKGRGTHRVLVAAVTLGVTLVVASVVAILTAFAWFDVSLSDGVGDRFRTPASAADVKREYKLGIGDLRIDLSHVRPDAELDVRARLGIGNLKVVVPREASVAIDAHAKAGKAIALDRVADGRDARAVAGAKAQFRIDAEVGAGKVEVVRAS